MTEVKGISKLYGNKYAVKDLSFTADKGKIYGFLGPNGAGKSTTLNIMTACLSASEGTVVVDGLDVYKNSDEYKKQIGFLPEIPPLYPDMTPLESLNFVADAKGLSRTEKDNSVSELLELCMLTNVKDRLIKNLSKGYKQRVGIAEALIGDPKLIILDEPMVGLDPKQLVEMRNLISSLKEERTIILSSHILSEVEEICDSLIIISKGQLVAQGSLEEIASEYIKVNSLMLNIKGDVNKIRMALNDINEITYYEIENCTDNTYNVHIEYPKTDDIREKLFFTFSQLSMPILQSVNTTMSLQDVFLKLTDKSDDTEELEAEYSADYFGSNSGQNKKSDETDDYKPLFGSEDND